MRGIVFDGSGLVGVDDLEVRDPGPGELLVRMLASGICQSDLHAVDGDSPRTPPIVLGHEGAAEVVALGSGAAGVGIGERVVLSALTPCRSCAACASGRLTDCASAFGSDDRPFTWRGTPTARFANTASWAEFAVVRADQAHPIGELAPAGAALIGCAVSTAWGNVVNVADVRPDDTVAVIGIGGIGANVVQCARLAGASRIIAVDLHDDRRAIAERFGATDVIITRPDDSPVEAVRDLTGGGVDHVFECAGLVSTIEAAIAMTGRGGSAILIGMPPVGSRASFDTSALFRGRRIIGSLNGAVDPARDFPQMIWLARNGHLDLDALVSETFPFDRWSDAIAAARSGSVIRSVIDFEA